MVRVTALLFLMVCAAQAFGDVTAERFVWERSGRFFLLLTADGVRMELKGNVRLGETGDARQGAVAAQVKSYAAGQGSSPVISAIITNDGNNDVATVILIQADGDGDTKKILTPNGIPDRKASVLNDLEFILNGLKSRKNWDALASFNWLAATSSGKALFQVAQKVEVASDADISLPRPQSRVAEGQGPTVRTPQLPAGSRPMDPSALDNGPSGYPPPPGSRMAGRPPADDDSMFSDDPRAQQPRYRQPQYGDGYGRQRQYGDGSFPQQYDGGGYPPPPEMQGQVQRYPQQRYPQQGQRYPQQQRGYAGNGYPPPPPPGQGGLFNQGGLFGGLFNN